MNIRIKMRDLRQLSIFKIAFAPLFFSLFYAAVFGQITQKTAVSEVAPKKEQFEDRSDLLIPWRDTICLPRPERVSHPGCNFMTMEESLSAHRLSLYNGDGSLWYTFSLFRDESDYFYTVKKKDFVPFSTDESAGYVPDRKGRLLNPSAGKEEPRTVRLRMTGESENWYAVEVNEDTRMVKYAPKTAHMWSRVGWDFLFLEVGKAYIDSDTMKLVDRPEGKPIPISETLEFSQIFIYKIEGDWAYVEAFRNPESYFGWVRWRSGRNILIGCVYNDFTVPSTKESGHL